MSREKFNQLREMVNRLRTDGGAKKLPPAKQFSVKTFMSNNVRANIRHAAANKMLLKMTYKKVSGETKTYTVEPYSYRYRRIKAGLRKMFYAYDTQDRTIKGFVLRGVKKAIPANIKFRPRWPVEIV